MVTNHKFLGYNQPTIFQVLFNITGDARLSAFLGLVFVAKKNRLEVVRVKHNIRFARILVAAAVLGLGLLVAMQASAKTISAEDWAERLKPAGELCLQGMDCGGVAAPVVVGPKSADQVYNSVCMACHDTGAAGAPKRGDAAAWAPRITQGIATLYEHSLTGIRGMPAKGGNPNLSDDEVKSAVDYIVEASR